MTVHVLAEAAYQAWLARNINRYGSALRGAFLDGYHAGSPYLTLTSSERREHRFTCLYTCLGCEAFRAQGDCAACGLVRGADDQGDCDSCGGPLRYGSDPTEEPNRDEWEIR